ncbi:MAG: VOC family protein [Gammaproteobacteria bacterium]|nr:VOC family protein [Gammaproteobacteria bacterium]
MPGYLESVFGAEEVERHEVPGKRQAHVEVRVGDSVIIVEAGAAPVYGGSPAASVCVYVDDVDAAYARALDAGAVSVEPPSDKPYGERSCGVRVPNRDPSGNTWWMSRLLP